MSDNTNLRRMAKQSIVDYCNSTASIVNKFGEITSRKVVMLYETETARQYRMMAKVKFDDKVSYCFEYAIDTQKLDAVISVYKKQKSFFVK